MNFKLKKKKKENEKRGQFKYRRERERKKYTQRYKNIYIIEERNVGYDII